MTKPVAFILGSDSDLKTIEAGLKILDTLEIGYQVRILSAHRTPDETREFTRSARSEGVKVLIGVAGMAAHLAGALAAHSSLPVLGVPVESGPLSGKDALLSTVMMPPGVPVGCLGIGSSGAQNAALLAARILALADEGVADRLDAFIDAAREKTLAKDVAAQRKFG